MPRVFGGRWGKQIPVHSFLVDACVQETIKLPARPFPGKDIKHNQIVVADLKRDDQRGLAASRRNGVQLSKHLDKQITRAAPNDDSIVDVPTVVDKVRRVARVVKDGGEKFMQENVGDLSAASTTRSETNELAPVVFGKEAPVVFEGESTRCGSQSAAWTVSWL
eukprot:SAG11_NODE_4681_length_1808_cov_2.149795_3_plen_163_part_01